MSSLSCRVRHCFFDRIVCCVSYFFVTEWISAMYPPGNLTTAACALAGLVGRNKDLHASRFGLGKRSREIRHLVSDHLLPVWIRKMAIRYEKRQLAEVGLDPDSPIGFTRPSDLNTGSVRSSEITLPMGKARKLRYEGIHAIRWTHTHGFPGWFEAPYRTAQSCANRVACSRRPAIG